MKLPDKLKEKLDSHLIPENCTEIRAPVLNVERLQERMMLVFSMFRSLSMTATAALVNVSDQLHHVTTVLAHPSACGREQPNP